MPLILSTKILTPTQKRHLFLANLSLVEYNAVSIIKRNVNLQDVTIENAIFSSQNAVYIVDDHSISIQNAFCVGQKTAELVQKKGANIAETADNAKALAQLIVEKYPELKFDFFCSKQRRHELPAILKDHKIQFQEHHIYESVCNYKTFSNQFDAVLCFSPLGVKSYFSKNNNKVLAICIGETTAKAALEYTDQVFVSNKTSVESVILKAIKTLTY